MGGGGGGIQKSRKIFLRNNRIPDNRDHIDTNFGAKYTHCFRLCIGTYDYFTNYISPLLRSKLQTPLNIKYTRLVSAVVRIP